MSNHKNTPPKGRPGSKGTTADWAAANTPAARAARKAARDKAAADAKPAKDAAR